MLARVPTGPGVYRYLNEENVVIYVGKAKNLRRRLQNYRAAGRKKLHRKMLRVVKAASSLSYESLATEADALLLENQLIRELKPKLNVEGAFSFLYPALGVSHSDKQTLLCFTTQPEQYFDHGLSWYGTFRSRFRVKLAFTSLVDLLALIGHREKRSALPKHASLRGTRLLGFRQLPIELAESMPRFFGGEDAAFLRELARLLLSKPRARRDAAEVEEKLRSLKLFFDADAVVLRQALQTSGRAESFVPAQERDALLIRARFTNKPPDLAKL